MDLATTRGMLRARALLYLRLYLPLHLLSICVLQPPMAASAIEDLELRRCVHGSTATAIGVIRPPSRPLPYQLRVAKGVAGVRGKQHVSAP
jgi:hypothetical protein